MARAETIQSVGEPGRGGSSLLPGSSSCRMQLPGPFHPWSSLFTTTAITTGSGTGTGAIHLYHPPTVGPSLPYSHPQGQDESQTPQQPPAFLPILSSPLCSRREDRGGSAVAPSALSEQQSGSERAEHQDALSRQGPLPDLLPQSEHPAWLSPHHRAPRGEARQELEVRRVANQLRAIGDEFNARVLHRVHAEPHWRDWRDVCRGLFSFISQTLSTLYRLT